MLLGIDLGTSYFKVGIFAPDGTLRGLGRVAVDPERPAPGRVELPVEAFWLRIRRGLAEALQQAGIRPSEISGLSYSSQANTFVVLDKTDQPLTPLIFWNDERALPLDPALADFALAPGFQARTGFGEVSGLAAPAKLRWLQRHAPQIWSSARRVLTISEYFTFMLSGEAVGDGSTAAFTGLFDLETKAWWPEALSRAGMTSEMLSRLLRPGTSYGRTTATGEAQTGLPAGIPLAVGGLDHHVAAIGSGLGRLADVSISTGTVLAALVLVDRVEPVNDCYHGPHVDGVQFYRLAFDVAGARQLDDYQRQRAPELGIDELITLAGQVPGSAAAGEHGAAVRAILERIAATHRALVRKVVAGRPIERVVATGGGARSALWLQIKADQLGIPVLRSASPERACLGAAAFAAVAAGHYASIPEALGAMVRTDRVFEPIAANVARYRRAD